MALSTPAVPLTSKRNRVYLCSEDGATSGFFSSTQKIFSAGVALLTGFLSWLHTIASTPSDADVCASFSPPCRVKAVREDLGLQRLALETCRGHLRCLRAGAAQPSTGGGGDLAVDVGGGPSARGVAGGVHGGGPRDEADAGRAGKAAVKRCAVLAPLLLKEFLRQVGVGARA